jgi:hypothetical protein
MTEQTFAGSSSFLTAIGLMGTPMAFRLFNCSPRPGQFVANHCLLKTATLVVSSCSRTLCTVGPNAEL